MALDTKEIYGPQQLQFTDVLAPNFLDRVHDHLEGRGYALFGGIDDPEQFLTIAEEVGVPRVFGMTDAQGVTTLTSLEGSGGTEAGTYEVDHELLPHTDGCAMGEPAQFLMLYCVQADTEGGGVSMLADASTIYEAMRTEQPELLAQLEVPGSIVFGPADQPEKQYRTSIISKDEHGLVSIRLRRDEEAWYVTDDGEMRPLAELDDVLAPFYDVIDRETIEFSLGPGQGFVVNNRRMLHGRTTIKGEREIKRVMLDVPQDPWLGFIGRDIPKGFYPKSDA